MVSDAVLVSSYSKKENIFIWLFKNLGYFCVFYLLSIASVSNTISPFRFGLYFTLIFLGINYSYLVLPFFVSSILVNNSLNGIINAFIVTFGCALIYYFVSKQKINGQVVNKPVSMYVAVLFAVLLNIPSLFLLNYTFTIFLLNLICGVLFLIDTWIFVSSIVFRRGEIKLNIDELVCGAILLIGLFCGIKKIDFYYIDVVRALGIFSILFFSYISRNEYSTMLGVIIGLGCAVSQGELEYIALFSSVGVVCGIFKNSNKIYSCLGVVLLDVFMGLCFNTFEYGLINLLSTVGCCCVFILIPNMLIEGLKDKFFPKDSNFAIKNIVNFDKKELSKNLSELSEVFFDMDKTFRKMVKGNLPIPQAKKMLCDEIVQNNCQNCIQKNKCLRAFGSEMKNVFEGLINIGFEKGKISLIDLPQYLTSRCQKVNQLISSINTLLNQYKQYSRYVNNLDDSKVLIADQLCGISGMLKNMSKDLSSEVKYNIEVENKIKQELIYKNILVRELSVYEKTAQICNVTMVVKDSDVDVVEIDKIVNKYCGKMVRNGVYPSEKAGLSIIQFVTAPNYDIAFGLAQKTKAGNDISGDCQSFLRLSDDRFILAICDGMGSGEKARDTSETAIGLIENLYKAGFNNEIVLSCVNRLLNLGRDEIFSSVDVSVIDLKNACIDFIKLGAPIGLIKHSDTTNIIDTGALPIGILDKVAPKITKTTLDTQDMVILFSDGVIDAFKSEDIVSFINNINSINPQLVAETILSRALELEQGLAQDDMTVLVGRIYEV